LIFFVNAAAPKIAAMLGPFDLVGIAVIALVFIPLERLLPLRRDQKLLRPHWRNDAAFMILNVIPITFGVVFLSYLFAAAAHSWMPSGLVASVRAQPIWLQAIGAILVADVGFYLAHRTFHAVPFLWRFHAVHHSIEELDWLAAYRVHPLDQILTKSASILPVILLGFSDGAVAIYVLLYKWQSLAIHSNSRIGLGPLKWVFASPQFHHWHHANEPQAIDRNFAGQLAFLDWIGRTLYMPARMPHKYGTDAPMPQRFDRQMVHPFRRQVHAPPGDVAA
jgi:sterol desaturase/sphingolipid hydroxylase (fatty acid hydroxylase superfamily)